jgi:hypothetical protein
MANTRNSQHQVESSKVAEWLAIAACVMTVASSLAVFVHRLLVPESDIARKVMKALYVELELNVPAFYSATLMLFATYGPTRELAATTVHTCGQFWQ